MSVRWLERRVLVTVGTGGVGKTTLAAAIGLEAARRGRRVLVLTIDPALRLGDALGIGALTHDPQRVPSEIVDATEAPEQSGGELYAMMLDTQRTLDELVDRIAPNPELRQRIRTNRIYRSLTDALSGTREYSAMEKLHELDAAGEFDLIVLDTPPATHALQFLEAPRRMLGFLDGSFLQLLLRPAASLGRASFRFFRAGADLALRAFEKMTGLGFLSDLSDFLLASEELLDGFGERARAVSALLRSERCGFVLVAAPEPEQIRSSERFIRQLRDEQVKLVGLIANRVSTLEGADPGQGLDVSDRAKLPAALAQFLEPELARACSLVIERHAQRVRRDGEMVERLEKLLPLPPGNSRRVPRFSRDIHTSDGLRRLGAALFEDEN